MTPGMRRLKGDWESFLTSTMKILYRKRYRVAFHYIHYRSVTTSLQRIAIADSPCQNPHSKDIDIKRGKEVRLSCETSLFAVAHRTFRGGRATTWLLPLSHK